MKPEGGPALDFDFDVGSKGWAVMTICQFIVRCRRIASATTIMTTVVRVLAVRDIIAKASRVARRSAPLDLLAHLGTFTVPLDEYGNCLLLPRLLARQGVDLRLPFRGQGGELRPIALEERARIGRLTPTIASPAWQ